MQGSPTASPRAATLALPAPSAPPATPPGHGPPIHQHQQTQQHQSSMLPSGPVLWLVSVKRRRLVRQCRPHRIAQRRPHCRFCARRHHPDAAVASTDRRGCLTDSSEVTRRAEAMTVLVECGFTHLCTSEVSHRPPGSARGSAHTIFTASASALLHPCNRL